MNKDKLKLMEVLYGVNDNNDGIWDTHNLGEYADAVLADGWIRPPCKIGQTVYVILNGTILTLTVKYMYISRKPNRIFAENKECRINFRQKDIGTTVFFSEEEAAKALEEKERKKNV